MPPGISATAVAAFNDGSLLATVTTLPGKTMNEAFALKRTGAVFAWSPGDAAFRIVPATDLPAGNGIETSRDDREFYVVSSTLKRVFAYSRPRTPETPAVPPLPNSPTSCLTTCIGVPIIA